MITYNTFIVYADHTDYIGINFIEVYLMDGYYA